MQRPPIQAPGDSCAKPYLKSSVPFSLKPRETTEYVYNIVATGHGIAATGSTHRVNLYDASRLERKRTVGYHNDTITSIKSIDENTLVTGSKDQSILVWDLRTNLNQASQQFKATKPVLSFDASPGLNLLAAGTIWDVMESSLQFWDFRTSKALHAFVSSHSNDITSLQFSPQSPGQLLSSSTDGLLCLFDARQSDEDEALITSANINASISRANYTGANYDRIFAMTDMETLSIWTHELDPIVDFGDMRILDQPGFELDYMISGSYDANTDRFLVSMGSNGGNVYVLAVDADSINPCWIMEGGHTEIVRDIILDVASGTAITCGEDGLLSAWSSSPHNPVDDPAMSSRNHQTPEKKSRQQPSGHGTAAGNTHARFTPY
ncbi:hypothetical protein H4219_003357 [Mycoemilia scoparia]|uniref:WD40 repeat-like protein n=1 Tax=Mycoemilia scoparia TaxID=417184 RepID=A0A9W8A4D8_9FUNG|nr:hypothetical protein H4219_003357 [Mycoemilia scoparia]